MVAACWGMSCSCSLEKPSSDERSLPAVAETAAWTCAARASGSMAAMRRLLPLEEVLVGDRLGEEDDRRLFQAGHRLTLQFRRRVGRLHLLDHAHQVLDRPGAGIVGKVGVDR